MSPINKRHREASVIVDTLQKQTNIKGIEVTYSIESNGPPVGANVEIKLNSDNDLQRNTAAKALVSILENNTNVSSIMRNDKSDYKQQILTLDYVKLETLDVSINQVQTLLTAFYNGVVVYTTTKDEEDRDIRLFIDNKNHNNPLSLKVVNKNNRFVNLSEFAKLQTSQAEPIHYHNNGVRSITITANINEKNTTPQVVNNKTIKELNTLNRVNKINIDEADIVSGGLASDTADSLNSLGRAFIIAIIAIDLLLSLLFNSAMQPLLVMSAIPFGLMGVIFSFYLHQTSLSFIAMLGVIGMVGVVVNDSLILVSRINQLYLSQQPKNIIQIIDLVSGASKERLRAIVLTTLTTFVSVIPIAYGIGGADPFLEPMALALGYGLVFATPLTLILLPCLYVINADFIHLWRRYFPKKSLS